MDVNRSTKEPRVVVVRVRRHGKYTISPRPRWKDD